MWVQVLLLLYIQKESITRKEKVIYSGFQMSSLLYKCHCSIIQYTVLFCRLGCGIVKIALIFSKTSMHFFVSVLVVQKLIYLTLSSMPSIVSIQIVLAQCWKAEYMTVRSRKSSTSLFLTM